MHTRMDKSKQSNGQDRHTGTQRQASEQNQAIELPGQPDFGFQDNRPAAIAQRRLQRAIEQSPRQQGQAAQFARLFGMEVQQQVIEEDEEQSQGKFETVQRLTMGEGEPLQGRFERGQAARLEAADTRVTENRTGMPDRLKTGVEALSGMDLSDVRVHRNSDKPAQLNALAYAQGNEIHLGPGQEQHLQHEAWHVVQQRQGRVRPTVQMAGVQVNDEEGLEREADLMGGRAMQAKGLKHVERPDHNPQPTGIVQPQVVQRVRGGIEYTEDGPTMLYAYPAANFVANAPRHSTFTVAGRPMSAFRVGAGIDNNATLGAWTNEDFDVVRTTANVRLTNDVRSAEWIIERHQADLPAVDIRRTLKEDIGYMFQARDDLASAVTRAGNGYAGEVGITGGTKNDTNAAPGVFIYKVGPKKGKAQITAQYSNEETIRRINKLNASKFLTGTKVAVGEDVARVTGTEGAALQHADVAGTTSFSTAGVLLGQLVAGSTAIPRTGGGGDRLTQAQVGLVKLMVVNDALATTMVRYQDVVGQGQEKNIQRFFPKSRRDEYVRTIAQADLDATEMGLLRIEIQNTSAADAQLVFNSADPGALRTDEAFTELVNAGQAAAALNYATAKGRLLDPTQGPANPVHVLGIKTAVLGANGALLAGWIMAAARAYTDQTLAGTGHLMHDPGKANQTPQDIIDYGIGGGGVVGTVIETSRGFTPVQGRGAIYEMREREIDIDQSGLFNIGSMNDINDAIDRIFGAAG